MAAHELLAGTVQAMTALTRITADYVPQEDRIRLSGERAGGEPLAIWLSRRMLNRMLPVLLQWLEREGGKLPAVNLSQAQTLQSFAQQAARASHTPQPPVRVAPDGESWLAHSVDVSSSPQAVRLTFKAADGRAATLTLTAQQLRQWLGILHEVWTKAEWQGEVWPEWVRGETAPVIQQSVVVH